MFAGASLDLKGASWEWLIYSHLNCPLAFGRAQSTLSSVQQSQA